MKDFTKYEFNERLTEMTSLLQEQPGWGNGYQSSTGQTLIELMTHVTDELHYMLQRRTMEQYITTASLRSSIIARASELGYQYDRSVGNSGYVEITATDEFGNDFIAYADINIPEMTILILDDIEYITLESATIPQGESSTVVNIKQGKITTLVSEIDVDNRILLVDFENIDNDLFFVSVDGEQYLDVNSQASVNKRALTFLDPLDAFFDIKHDINGMSVVFGDDFSGKKPDSAVTMNYTIVDQEAEAINTIGRDFVFDGVEFLTDVNINDYYYTIKNTTKIDGYVDAESNESIKTNAVTYHKTNGRAVTNDDYAYWTLRTPGVDVVDVGVVGEDDLDSLIYNLNNVYITYLKDDGTDLTVTEHQKLRDFMETVKTSQAHLVFNSAKKLDMQVKLDVKRGKTLPIADAEVYDTVLKFLQDYFILEKGSIGKEVQSSDIIKALYDQKVLRNNVEYDLIDFAKIEVNGIVPLSFPFKTNKAFVDLASNYSSVQDDNFVLLLDNVICEVVVDSVDTSTEILTKMRDKIIEVTPYDARIVFGGVVFDAFGNSLPIEIDTSVGKTLLIGTETPFDSPVDIVSSPAIGTTLVYATLLADAVAVQHFYYSSRAGRRPMIPMRNGTTVTLTAPSDTDIKAFTRLVKGDASTEVLLETIAAGASFTQTFAIEHILQFEYVNNSTEDIIVDIDYPSFDGTAYGLEISSKDNFGDFVLLTSSGDLTTYITTDYSYFLPMDKETVSQDTKELAPGTVAIYNSAKLLIIRDTGDGFFKDIDGIVKATGSVNYYNGEIVFPTDMENGEYYVSFSQNVYGNFEVDNTTAIQLIDPIPSYNDAGESLSRITLVQ
ncbi:MAG: hypothetical protein PF440_04145 [Thiomicrorhabdus sp.]|jgi:hypothetical protein|nr:hypothetical protein [Thiomicrorhabdus sp.]